MKIFQCRLKKCQYLVILCPILYPVQYKGDLGLREHTVGGFRHNAGAYLCIEQAGIWGCSVYQALSNNSIVSSAVCEVYVIIDIVRADMATAAYSAAGPKYGQYACTEANSGSGRALRRAGTRDHARYNK